MGELLDCECFSVPRPGWAGTFVAGRFRRRERLRYGRFSRLDGVLMDGYGCARLVLCAATGRRFGTTRRVLSFSSADLFAYYKGRGEIRRGRRILQARAPVLPNGGIRGGICGRKLAWTAFRFSLTMKIKVHNMVQCLIPCSPCSFNP
jgi:hypothetical protein